VTSHATLCSFPEPSTLGNPRSTDVPLQFTFVPLQLCMARFLCQNPKPRVRLAIFLFKYSILCLKPGALSFKYDILLFRFPVLQSNFLFHNSDTLFGY